MTINEHIKYFESQHSDLDVKEVYEDENFLLFIAPHKGDNVDYSDPFYLYNKDNKKSSGFVPTENLDLYSRLKNPKNKVYEV